MSNDRRDLDKLKAALKDNAEALTLELFGEPTNRQGNSWRWGRRGSTSVTVKGRWRGRFYSFEAAEGGTLLDAIGFALGVGLADAIAWAKDWLGWRDNDGYRPSVHKPLPVRPPVVDLDAYELDRQRQARQQWAEAVPIEGTPGAAYLESRAICPEGWPSSVRWHQRRGALLFAKLTPDGSAITQIQAVHVHPDGSPVMRRSEEGAKPSKLKLTIGPGRGGAVRFEGDERALCLAEGPETAASVWFGTGIETWAALGSTKSVNLKHVPLSRTVVICRDDDPRNAPSGKAVRDAIRKWRREGRTVVEALPWPCSKRDRSDFNDVLREQGPRAVRERIEAALAPVEKPAQATMPVQWARKNLADAMRKALTELWERCETTPALAVRVGLGVGKTQAALEAARDWISEGKGAVAFAVPEHELGADVLGRARALGINAAVWRGREAINPATASPMCGDLETVKAVERTGGNAQFLACHNGKSGAKERKCPLFDACAYQRQRRAEADLWIVPHALLFTGKPEGIPHPSLLVIDEDFWQAGLAGSDWREPVLVTADELQRRPLVPRRGPGVQGFDDDASAELVDELWPLRQKLLTAFEAAPLGYLTRQAILQAGLTAEDCGRALELEWKRWREPAIWPGMTPEARQAALEGRDDCRDVPRLRRLWRILAELLAANGPSVSGGVEIVERKDRETGASYRALRLQWRKAIAEGWQAPTLAMSATLRLDLVRPYFPGVKLAADIAATAPHQRVIYWHGKSFSHSNLHALRIQQGEALAAAAAKLRRAIWAHAMALHRANGGETLLIVPKTVEAWLRAEYAPLPAGVHLAHHGAIAGRDEWKNVRTLIVIGRPMPPPDAVGRMASALTGAHVEPETAGGWYPSVARTLADKAGRRVSVEIETAGDGAAGQVLAGIAEDAIAQAIGRGRGVNRTADDPLDVHLLGTGPVEGLAIDELAEWRAPSEEAEVVAVQGVWLASAADMACVIGITPGALRVQRHRMKAAASSAGQNVTVPCSESLHGNVTLWSGVRYRRKIERHGWQEARFAPGAVDDPAAWLEARLGPVEVEALPMESANDAVETMVEVRIDETTVPEPMEPCCPDKPELPEDWRSRLVLVQRSQGWSQEETASHLGLARPTLANAIGGRYDLGNEAAERLLALLERPPPIRQMALLL